MGLREGPDVFFEPFQQLALKAIRIPDHRELPGRLRAR